MNFELDETQDMLRDGARRLFSTEYEGEKGHQIDECSEGYSSNVWSQMVELGWSSVALPEAVGGSNLGVVELCILAEEVGRAGASTPLLACAGLTATILKSLPEQSLAKELLGSLTSSNDIITTALIDQHSRDEYTAPTLQLEEAGDTVTLSGLKQLVPYADSAKVLIVSGQFTDGSVGLVVVDATDENIAISRHKILGGDPKCQVAFNQVSVPNNRVLARGNAATAALNSGLQVATVMAMAEVVGSCEGIINLTAEYAKIREQFGTPIGAFQAVSHPIADMRIQTDACRMLAYEAAWLLDNKRPADFEIASAKVFVNEAVATIAVDGQRLHGAIGYSNEYDLQLFTRRAKAFCVSWGNNEQQVEAAAAALGI